MQYVSIQQLSMYAGERKSIGDRLVLLDAGDVGRFAGSSFIGSRVMILVSAGALELFINGYRNLIREGSFVDVLEGTMLQFGDMAPGTELYCVFTTRSFMMDALQEVVPDSRGYFSKIILNPVMEIADEGMGIVRRIVNMLAGSLADTGHRYRMEMVKLYIKAFSLELSNAMRKDSNSPLTFRKLSKKELLMASFIDLVWKNFTENREVSFYARQLCVTPKHLSRAIKDACGKTPHEIIASEVLSLAVQLLQNRDMLVQQIADLLHFSDQAAFSKFFRKYTGVSPAEFRRQYRE